MDEPFAHGLLYLFQGRRLCFAIEPFHRGGQSSEVFLEQSLATEGVVDFLEDARVEQVVQVDRRRTVEAELEIHLKHTPIESPIDVATVGELNWK